MNTVLSDCRLLDLPKLSDERGSLCFFEAGRHIPFPIQRIYYLYDVPVNAVRGEHAHRALQQVIVAIQGEFRITLSDGTSELTHVLNRPDLGLYICPMIWRRIEFQASAAVCMVAASALYEEADYIRDKSEFLRMTTSSGVPIPGQAIP